MNNNDLKYMDNNGLLYFMTKIKNLIGTKQDKVEGKGLSTNDYTTEEKTKLAGLSNYDDTSLSGRVTTLENAGYQTQSQVQTLINNSISSVMTYKGTVANYSDLPSSNVAVGDTYNITNADPTHDINAGDNVAWTGSAWDKLGNDIDLSAYVQRSELVAITNAEIDTLWNSANSNNASV